MEARYMTDLEWRICHAVNIYVFKNGNDSQTPILVHIPPSRKKTMQSVMDTVQERVTYPVGYAKTLYTMDGRRIRHPCELEMYNNYVVASNFEKAFKCVEYGRKRSPLLILNRYSKHIRVLRLQNDNYDQWLRKKREMGSERPQYIYPERYIHEGILPQDLPVDRMGNTYVPNCDVDPNTPDYAEKHDMRKVPTRNNQQKNYAVNAFTVEQDPIEEYMQHAESKEMQDQNSAQQKIAGLNYQNAKQIKTSGQEEQIPSKQFKALGQDQVFYQPQKKWRTKGVLDKNKDEHFPLFPTASDVLNANTPTANEEDVEDIAILDEDDSNDVEVIDELGEDNDNTNNPVIETVHKPPNNIISNENEKKITHKTEKKTGNSKKRIHSGQSNGEDSNYCNDTEELDEKNNPTIIPLKKPIKKLPPNKREKNLSLSHSRTVKKPANCKRIIRSKQSNTDSNCNDVEVADGSDQKYESNRPSPVIVTVSMPAKKSTPSKKGKVVTFSQKKSVRKIGETSKIINSTESNEIQEEQTKQFTPLVQDQVLYQPKLWISSEGPQYVYPERYMHQGILLQDLPVDRMGNTFVPHYDMNAHPNTTEYIKMPGMCNGQPRPNQQNNYTNTMAADQGGPPREYMHMQHASNEMHEQYSKHFMVLGQEQVPQGFRIEHKQFIGREEQAIRQFKLLGQEEQVAKQFQTLEQDQMFYQPQEKWRTNGVLENNQDLPLFPRASEMLIAKSSTEYEEDIEDITTDADNGNYVEDDLEEDSDSNTVTVTVKMHEKKCTPNKMEKSISLSQKKTAKSYTDCPYNITRSPKGSTMREKFTQTESD